MSVVPEGIRQWSGLDGPAAVLRAVQIRARRGHDTENGRLSAVVLSSSQRQEVGRLLGNSWALSGRPVQLRDVAARLAEHGMTVRRLVEALYGEVELDADVRRMESERARAEDKSAEAELIWAGVLPQVARDWLADEPILPAAGAGDRLGVVWEVSAIWIQLPDGTTPPVRHAQLAGVLLGDAHSLDADQLLGKLVARLAAMTQGLARPTRAGRIWRLAWASVGVLCDEVSSRVLAVNLALEGNAHAVRLCSASVGEPVWLSLRSLRGDWNAVGGPAFVCENPTVAEAAADRLGAGCPPLICTDGVPTTAALDLVAGLAAADIPVSVRADFDHAGLVVVKQLVSVAPAAEMWRFDVATYLRHTTHGTQLGHYPDLRSAIDHIGQAVHEEALLDDLLADLSSAAVP
ncbi:DUF2399 domain-containing protein [Kribbella kalugense]|uniref:Uncharacterized protein (TIGR02679 family) n=1 Tax=Kribbella kalugense TaxID=2512221 RepID=A0A4R8A1M1_9ACTN|nr:DUF2399 domain-containing protein [Kribbella kalugense]TDW24312.1 uncharacterized protein (TIGR02679 family) [Kribbella kalugense]